jgi:hypothetical protein
MKQQNSPYFKTCFFVGYCLFMFLLAGCRRESVTVEPKPEDSPLAKTFFDTLIVRDVNDAVVGQQIRIRDFGEGIGTTRLTPEYTYMLLNRVYVMPSQSLTILPGTVVKCAAFAGGEVSGLVVCRGAKIFAVGTPDHPIRFTAQNDSLILHNETIDRQRGLWGGLTILGQAPVDRTGDDTIANVAPGFLPTDRRALYGGADSEDNSGQLAYVSICHGGFFESNATIEPLMLAGVGSGTRIEHIETFFCNGSGIRIIGGTVPIHRFVSSYNAGDGLYASHGYVGSISESAVLLPNEGNLGGNGIHVAGRTQRTSALCYNSTFIGNALDTTNQERSAVKADDNSAIQFINNIAAHFKHGALLEDREGDNDAWGHLATGTSHLRSNVWWGIEGGNGERMIRARGASDQSRPGYFSSQLNLVCNPRLLVSYTPSRTLNLSPTSALGCAAGSVALPDSSLRVPDHKGAFPAQQLNWLKGWTKLDRSAYLR